MTHQVEHAIALHLAGRLDDAERAYTEILAADPETADACKGLGALLLQTHRFKDAYDVLQKARTGLPDDSDVLNNLGTAALQCGKLDEAEECYGSVVADQPDHVKAQINFGVVLHKQGKLQEAARALEQAIILDAKISDTHFNYSRTLRALGRLDEAEAAARRALDLAPDNVDARIDLGVTKAAQGDVEAAEQSYRSALTVSPRAAVAHHNLAQLLLQGGKLREGWAEFEWRWKMPDFAGAETFRALPPWKGETLDKGTLFVWSEQGVGDQILYAGQIPDLEGKAESILVGCTARLIPAFKRSFPFAQVVDQAELQKEEDLLTDVTAHVPSGSLGRFLRPSFDSFPNHQGYLRADPEVTRRTKTGYQKKYGDTPLVGLSWRSSNPKSGADKSVPLTGLASLLDDQSATFVDLQYGDTAEERAALQQKTERIIVHDDAIDPLTDLDTFAAHVAAMDLVVTVSNTTAHMAGALGVPCWVLLPAGPGLRWYWFLDRSDSPWYPSVRLFRQTSPGDWTPVVRQVKEALNGFLPA